MSDALELAQSALSKLTLTSGSWVELVEQAGSLRRLICDTAGPLLEQAMRQGAEPFEFWINFPVFSQTDGRLQDGLEALGRPDAMSVHAQHSMCMDALLLPLSLKAFRGLQVVRIGKIGYTVEDVIEYVANKRGGIHLDLAGLSPAQRELDAMSRSISVQEAESILRQSADIAETTRLSACINRWIADEVAPGCMPRRSPEPGLSLEQFGSWLYYAQTLFENDDLPAAKAVVRSLVESTSDGRLQGRALSHLGILLAKQGAHLQALHFFSKALTRLQESDDLEGVAIAHFHIGSVEARRGNSEAAEQQHRKALEVAEHAGDEVFLFRLRREIGHAQGG